MTRLGRGQKVDVGWILFGDATGRFGRTSRTFVAGGGGFVDSRPAFLAAAGCFRS